MISHYINAKNYNWSVLGRLLHYFYWLYKKDGQVLTNIIFGINVV